jgi:hypothetical protein
MDVDYYLPSEIPDLVKNAGHSLSTFYRHVNEGKIGTYDAIEGQAERVYKKPDVNAFLSRKPRKKRKGEEADELESEVKAQVSLYQEEDKPAVYYMETELLGVKHTLSPDLIWSWQVANDHTYWILHDLQDRRDRASIWGTLGVLPLQGDILHRVLNGDMKIQDIPITAISRYELGHTYSGLIVSMNVRTEKRAQFHQLLQSLFRYWSEMSVYIDRLYAFADIRLEEMFPLRILRELGFLLRTDIVSAQPIWELRFDLWNPSPLIQQFAEQQKGKRMIATGTRKKVATSHFVLATSREDIEATVDIDNEIFGVSDIPKELIIAVRQEWVEAEPESIYVLKTNNTVLGYHAMMALTGEKILGILKETDRPVNIRQKDIFPFKPGRELDVYIIVTGLRPSLSEAEEGTYSARLLYSISKVFQSLGQRGVVIRRIYGRSRTPEGIKIMQDMGFEELDFSPVHGKHLFVLDVLTSEKQFLSPYKVALAEYQ